MTPQVAILAGGSGVRLRPITLTTPKPMAPVAGRPFLDHLFRLLVRQQLTRVVLLTGYLGEQIEAHFGSGAGAGVSLTYVREAEPRGTAGAVRDARHVLDETFLLLNGDTFLNCDFARLHHRLFAAGTEAVMAVYDNAEPVAPANVSVTTDGRVAEYSREERTRMTHVDAGAYALRRSILDRLPVSGPSSLEYDLFPALARAGVLAAFPVSSRFYDIGTLQQLAEAERVMA